jgi:hypothetical protein
MRATWIPAGKANRGANCAWSILDLSESVKDGGACVSRCRKRGSTVALDNREKGSASAVLRRAHSGFRSSGCHYDQAAQQLRGRAKMRNDPLHHRCPTGHWPDGSGLSVTNSTATGLTAGLSRECLLIRAGSSCCRMMTPASSLLTEKPVATGFRERSTIVQIAYSCAGRWAYFGLKSKGAIQ